MSSDDMDVEDAFQILEGKIERNETNIEGVNRNIEDKLENIFGDIEDNKEKVVELAHYARENRDNIEDLQEAVEELEGSPKYDIDVDFSKVENSIRYIGKSIRNIFTRGTEKAGNIDPDRRKVLIGVGALAAGDYTNIVPGDENSGEGYFRGGECGWDLDVFGLYGEQDQCTINEDDDPDPPTGDPSEKGTPEVMYAERNGEKVIPDESFGEADELIREYGDRPVDNYDVETVEDMVDQHGEDDVIYVTENDEIVVNDDGTLYSTTVEGIYNDAKDGTLGDN